jgi:hypothetical protein
MFTKALYYPYILIPDNLWLRRAILYWDKICPIVPWEVEEKIPRTHISKELRDYGVLDFIHPEDRLDWMEGQELSEPFLRIVTSEEFLSKVAPLGNRDYSYRIHKHKLAILTIPDTDSDLMPDTCSEGWRTPWSERNDAGGFLFYGCFSFRQVFVSFSWILL